MKIKHWIIILISIGLVIVLGLVIIRFVLYYSSLTSPGLSPDNRIVSPSISQDSTGVIIMDPAPSPSSETFLMDESWRYFKGNQEPPGDWNQPGFDDSNWLEGIPGFGFGDYDDTTVLDDMQDKYSSVYLRNEFYITDPSKTSPLILSIDYDDGFVAYINGVEFTRRNIKGDPPKFNNTATTDYETEVPQFIYIDLTLLQAGENILAFQVHNKSVNDPDLSLIPSLGQKQLPIELGDYWRYFKGSQEPPADWNQVEFDDSSWYLGASGFGYADKDDTTSITYMRGNYISIYTRIDFFIEDPGLVGLLNLEIDFDDGFVAYLNGVEVWRRNMTGDPPGFNTPADKTSDPGVPEFVYINPSLLTAGKNTLAVQVHNKSKNSSDLTLITALRQVAPYLQNVTQDSIVIMWENYGDPVLAKVRYREQGALVWRETSHLDLENIHEILITGLKSDRTYQYQVIQEGFENWIPGNPATFTTAPDSSSNYRFAAYGDSRTYHDRHANVVKSIINNDPDLVLNLGDLVVAGKNYALWGGQFFGPLADLMISTPLYPTIGNHELYGSGKLLYPDFFSLPNNERWYAFTYGCSRVISLDSNVDISPGSDQYTWLINEFESAEYKDSKWQVVAHHHPIYTSGPHKSDEIPVVDYFVPLFEEYGIDFVLTSHNHHYERSERNGIYYIVTGGGGAELYDFPNTDLNPYSQARSETYNHITLDFSCPDGRVEFNAWNIWNQVFDGPVEIQD